MLVLLIIFLITIPVVTQSVALKLPEESNVPRQTKPENIELAVTKDGDVYWGMQLIKDNEELVNRLKVIAVQVPQPELHIRGDLAGRYEFVGRGLRRAARRHSEDRVCHRTTTAWLTGEDYGDECRRRRQCERA